MEPAESPFGSTMSRTGDRPDHTCLPGLPANLSIAGDGAVLVARGSGKRMPLAWMPERLAGRGLKG